MRVQMLQTHEDKSGGTITRYGKGEIWDLSEEQAEAFKKAKIAKDAPPPKVDPKADAEQAKIGQQKREAREAAERGASAQTETSTPAPAEASTDFGDLTETEG